MPSTNSPASNQTTLYGTPPAKLVSIPYTTIASSASSFASSTDFVANAATALNKCVDTFIALGYWGTV